MRQILVAPPPPLLPPPLPSMSPVKHLGVFQFNPDVSENEIQSCLTALRGMVGQIDGLQEVLCGPYDSPEGLNDGFTHGFVMTFDCAASRDAYLPHPNHEVVKDQILPRLERVIVFDFEV